MQSSLRFDAVGAAPDGVRQDLIAGSVALASIALFVFTGSEALIGAVRWLFYAGGGSDRVALVALFLNIALILFAWRRYVDIRSLVEARAAAEQQVRTISTQDQLTRLLVRKSLLETGEELIKCATAQGRSVALLVVDLDQFKKINDVYGHIAGDVVLRTAADLLVQVAPQGSLCARVGGNEFALAFPIEEQGQDQVALLAEQVVALLGRPVDVSGVQVQLGASVGISRLAPDCPNMDSLLRRADIATNVAKNDGSRRIVWFDSSMESQLRARVEVESGLRRGIPLGEFLPFYQPIVDLRTSQVCGFEALARWAHPAGGFVDPELFITVAEETGLIGELFESLFQQALQDALSWDPSITLAVNISPAQLKDPLLAHKILKLLTQSGFPARRLEVEITETSLFENLATAQAIVSSLKNHGVQLALDDFGTGYSSLAHLRALPFDRIKIDRSFVNTMHKDSESMAIVRAVATMGDSLGVAVTGEGIEDAITAEKLRSIGCDKGQGWFYGRPLGADDVYQLLAERDLLSHQRGWPASDSAPERVLPSRRSARR